LIDARDTVAVVVNRNGHREKYVIGGESPPCEDIAANFLSEILGQTTTMLTCRKTKPKKQQMPDSKMPEMGWSK